MMQRRAKILLLTGLILLALGAALARRIHTWGLPVPVAYQLVTVTPAYPDGDRSWTYLRRADGHRTIATDSNGDGTVDAVLTENNEPTSFLPPADDDPQARWLVVCLDGVPYQEMLSLWEEGYLREFFRPVPLIAPFPSESEIALTEVFQSGPVPGYEHRYFDRAKNKLAGGMLLTFSEQNIPYLDLLDYDMGGIFKGMAYILPRKSYRADLGRLRKRFLASQEKIYLAHIASTDSLYHILPREEMRRLLIEVDSLLRELYFDAGGRLRITLFSDHGNSLVESRRVPLREHLEENGWRLANRLEQENDVVVPRYGLVGFMAVYTATGQAEKLAPILAQLHGVDFVLSRSDGGVAIQSRRGHAQLSWNQDATAYRYQPLTGDPLALATILTQLRDEGKVNAEGWVSDANLFAATQDHFYPDPGHRLRQWATNHVRNPSDLGASLQPGYTHGSGFFQLMVDMLSTHGSLDRQQSLGFAMSTDGPWQGALRSGDLLPRNLVELKATADGDQKTEMAE